MNTNITFSNEDEKGCLTVRVGDIAIGKVKIINVWSDGVDIRWCDRIITLPLFVLEK